MDKNQIQSLTIIGWGNQGPVWAQNLRDSGVHVTITGRPGRSQMLAEERGFTFLPLTSELLPKQNWFALLTPDHTHLSVLEELAPRLSHDSNIILAHGFSLLYENLAQRFPQWSFHLLAPKPIAREFRALYLQKKAVPALTSVESLSANCPAQKSELSRKLHGLARALGCTPFDVNAEMETKADLLSEQSLLCSLLPYGALLSYQHLRQMGVTAEAAYFECWYELRLIANTMVELGPLAFFEKISPNALLGSQKGQRLLFGKVYQESLKELQTAVDNGSFAKEVAACDFLRLKSEVSHFWSQQELQQVHDRLKNLFY